MTFSFRFFDQLQKPAERILQHRGVQRIGDELPVLSREDELGILEQIEVIGNAWQAHLERVANLADGVIALLQHLENAAAGWIAEGFEEEVQCSGI
jgi:hypothetical protein